MNHKIIAFLAAGLSALAISACGSDDQQNCVVLANGGNTLCGDKAAAWCDSTDAIRQDGMDDGGDPNVTESIRKSQAVCDQIRDGS
jgi:hypothetical protein